LFWRALAAFLALPGIVAFLVPWLLAPRAASIRVTLLPIVGVGTVLLLWCVRDFYVAGRGTLAPWAPPKHLVSVGLYRVSRNPMYVAVLVILVGWALAFSSLALAIYAAAVALAFHMRVIVYEEPRLARTFGTDWLAYRARVPRWLGPISSSARSRHRGPR
jgi:protein-S-isoprenylcysteine O-methyltransferase Ste14